MSRRSSLFCRCLVLAALLTRLSSEAVAQNSSIQRAADYHLDGPISRRVLENYLDRSVTMAYFLVTGKTEGNREYPYRNDDVRLIKNIGAKFIGRAIIYKKSKGCVTPSGWSCDSLPYLVELDNFGRSRSPNMADLVSHFVWGWDEISWFAQQSDDYRNQWLRYAHEWIRRTDPIGHLQMPVSRMISCPNSSHGSYRANTKSDNCPIGYSQEETIKAIWRQ